jgi:hypothetical protein
MMPKIERGKVDLENWKLGSIVESVGWRLMKVGD